MSEENKNKIFGMGRIFQEKLVQAMLLDRVWATEFIEIFNIDECLEPAYLKVVTSKYIEFYRKHKEFPSEDMLGILLSEELKNEKIIAKEIHTFLSKINTFQLNDMPIVKEKAAAFCKQQLLKKALIESSELVKDEKYDLIIEKMKGAISAGQTSSMGLDYLSDIDARYSQTFRNCVGTGIAELDDKRILNGGLGSGELGIITAPSGIGKTHFLIHCGAQALLQKKNVFHYTLELNERYVGIRYDSHLTGISSLECYEQLTEIKKYFQANKDDLGQLIIKEYPSKTITINSIRAHIEKMSYIGKKPDLIVIDYAGILRSAQKYELPRLEMQAVIQEMRALAKELAVPVWTAVQSNKEGAKAEVVDMTNLAESYGQAAEADVIIGMNRPPAQKATGYGNIYIAKNRAGLDGIQFTVHLDTARSKLRVLTEKESEHVNVKEEIEEITMAARHSDAMKKILRESRDEGLSFSKI